MKFILSAFLIASVVIAQARPPIITSGWDVPTPAIFRAHVAEFEAWGLFDGTSIRPTRVNTEGKTVNSHLAFSSEPWRWEEFATAVEDLQAAHTTTCRETFLMLYSNPGNVDWFDDGEWQHVVEHWRLLARLAKQGKLRGLLFDAEPYTKPYRQFHYFSQAQADQHTFADYRVKARQRGREVMSAVAEEFPDVTIFCYRLFSDMLQTLDSGDLNCTLASETYGLLPAFVDGWMEVAPATLTIIEGTESIGYRANSFAEYASAFTRERLRLAEFVSPENTEKFNRQLRIGQSLYLDAHINPPDHSYTIDHTNSSPADRFAANLTSALAASDGLVWLYGEQARWWSGKNEKRPLWTEVFPGVDQAIRCARDPAAFASTILSGDSHGKNSLTNTSFAASTGKAPAGWFTWQREDSHGIFSFADGLVSIRAAKEAVVGFTFEPTHDTLFAVGVKVRTQGRGTGELGIKWKTSAGKWTCRESHVSLSPTAPPDAHGWQTISGMVRMPEGASRLVFMISASAQTGEEDSCEFTDPKVIAVPLQDR